MVDKSAVQKPKPTAGVNNAPVPQETQEKKLTANELLNKFLLENNITLMLDTLDADIRVISDGSIIIGKPRITAKFRNA